VRLYHGDCLEIMPTLPAASVDLVLADLPYQVTACSWDAVIPFAPMWECFRHVLKPNGAVVLTACQPFTTALITSNPKWFRYELIWNKQNRLTGFGNANRMPLRGHENILVFYSALPTYNPQKFLGKPYRRPRGYCGDSLGNTRLKDSFITVSNGERYPSSVLTFDSSNAERGCHPSQKPVGLMAYLIRTYTNPGAVVLDNCMGSGTTGVAAAQERREFIGIEQDAGYFATAEKRIREAQMQEILPL
jgi:DNA modification methylase